MTTLHTAKWFVILLGVCLAAPSLRAQDAPSVFRAGIDVVHLDVSVLDANRKPLRGLTAADFTILEGGQPRPIVAFSAVDLPAPAAAGAAAEPAWAKTAASDVGSNSLAPEGRLVVLLVDTPTPMGPGAGRALDRLPLLRRVAHAVIDALAPGDLASLFFVSVPFNKRAVQDFTTDRARLAAAIDRPLALDFVPAETRGCALWDKAAEIADALAVIRGRRKSIMHIGFPDEPPKDCITVATTAARKLRLANVTMYDVNGAGLAAPSLEAVDMRVPTHFRGFLAEETGGRTMFDNSPERVVPAIMEESSSYYVLAFPALDDRQRPGEVHPIDVKVSRPGVTVFARSGYQATQTAKALEAEAKRKPLERTLEWTLPRTEVPMTIAAAPFAMPGAEKAAVAISLRVELPKVPEATTLESASPRRTEAVFVVFAVLDPYLSTVEGTMTQKAEFPVVLGTDGPRTYELLSRLSIAPGRYQLRAALETDTGMRGGVDAMLEVPRFDDEDLSISGLAMNVQPNNLAVPGKALDGLVPFAPTPRREFSALDTVSVFFQVYRKREAALPVAVTARVLDSSGRSVFERRGDKTGDYQVELPLDRLAPGRFLLEVKATAGDRSASRAIPFVVTP